MRKSSNRRKLVALWAMVGLFALSTGLIAKDKLDIAKQRLNKPFMPALAQTYVYHTNGALWMGWDSYGNTGDQTCSAIIPGWVYPGNFSWEGKGFLNYNCRAGYWIVGKIGGEFFEGTTGEYILTRGTEPGPTTQGWGNENDDYNKEPWISYTEWTIPDLSVTVKTTRRSWSFPGTTNNYFKIGDPLVDFDFNDFVIEEMVLVNTGTADIDELVVGGKADHDCTWNVPFPDWDFPYWTDDIVDYDPVTMTSMELDGDDQGSAVNDFGIDDPYREYRGVRVGQTPININGKNHSELSATDVTHMWWTGDEDPQTAAARFNMASLGFSGGDGDKKDINPSPMDMRYLQAYGPFSLAAGDSITLVFAVLAGAGLENTQNAAKAAKQAYDWEYNLPKPPAAPQIDWNWSTGKGGIETLSDGTVQITWSYSDAQINAEDPDKGVADFAGFRVYRAAAAPKQTSEDIFSDEGVTADSEGDVTQGKAFSAHAAGPYRVIAEGSASDFGSGGTYKYVDEKVAVGLMYWYYVAAYDDAGSDPVHGSVPSLESYYTMCYPLAPVPDGSGDLIPSAPPAFTVSLETLEYTDLDDKKSTGVFVAPNPWKASVMEQYHGADAPSGYFMRFYNVKAGDVVKIFDVTGNLVFESDKISASGSYNWSLVSRTRNQVTTGIYYWKVGDQTGKLGVIR